MEENSFILKLMNIASDSHYVVFEYLCCRDWNATKVCRSYIRSLAGKVWKSELFRRVYDATVQGRKSCCL